MKLSEQGKEKLLKWAESKDLENFPHFNSNDFEDAILVTNKELAHTLDYAYSLCGEMGYDESEEDILNSLNERFTRFQIGSFTTNKDDFKRGYSEYKTSDMPGSEFVHSIRNDRQNYFNCFNLPIKSLEEFKASHPEKSTDYCVGVLLAKELSTNKESLDELMELYDQQMQEASLIQNPKYWANNPFCKLVHPKDKA